MLTKLGRRGPSSRVTNQPGTLRVARTCYVEASRPKDLLVDFSAPTAMLNELPSPPSTGQDSVS
jgi:hypothetical protein